MLRLSPAFVRRWTWCTPGLGYLAAADPAQLSIATQARGRPYAQLEQADAVATAVRASFLTMFTAGQGYADDGNYNAVAWLMHRTGITRGAAVGHTAWAKRTGTHPKVLAALAARQVSEWVGRADLPVDQSAAGEVPGRLRRAADHGRGGRSAAGELAALSAEMYERARGDLPDEDPDRDFADRGLKLATTFSSAGVVHGDLTPDAPRPSRRCWTRCPLRQERRMTGPGISAITTRSRKPCAAWPPATCSPSGGPAGQDLGAHLPGRPAPPERQLGSARAVDRPGPRAVGRPPRRRVRNRERRRSLAGRRRRRGDRL